MSDTLTDRLNKVLPTITSREFLTGSGIGNEIGFYIFDYPPQEELRIREHIKWVTEQIPKHHPDLRVNHINLFELVLDYLKSRKLLAPALTMQREKGNDALKKALAGPLHENKIGEVFAKAAKPEEHDLILVSGVGSVWPLLRTHTLLNNLHKIMGDTPLVMFYPGKYDGQSLRLFGKLGNNNYYRAFKLIP